MKKRLRIIVTAFSLSFLLMAGLSFFCVEKFNHFLKSSDLVDHTNAVIKTLYRVEGYLKDMDRAERGYLLTKDTSYLRPWRNVLDSVYPTVNYLADLIKDNPKQVENMQVLKGSLALRIVMTRQSVHHADTMPPNSPPSDYYYNGRTYMKECAATLKAMHNQENELFTDRFKLQKENETFTSMTIKNLLITFCIITFVLFVLMIRELRSRMKYQDELQARVVDLKRSHAELEEIAYAASHDLQEPLRKIQVFCNMLLYMKGDNFDKDSMETLRRINNSANRMQSLIEDLVSLTTLAKIEEQKKKVSLNDVLDRVNQELQLRIEEKQATVKMENLPPVMGYANQLVVLFKALMDNSLKFSREDVKPMIVVTCEHTNGAELDTVNPKLSDKRFIKVTFSDNGMGFDNQFMTKMFRIFQRLHNGKEHDGKGIGLAICQRIMANHQGYIMAHGAPGQGASFKLFFPDGD
jgi:signal transduction histidine kinase